MSSTVTSPAKTKEGTPPRATRRRLVSRLYRGETSFDFVGRRKIWFVISSLVILAGLGSFAYRGLNFSIDFKGGVSWQLTDNGVSVAKATSIVEKDGLTNPTVTILGGKTLSIDAKVSGNDTKRNQVESTVADALAKATHTKASQVSVNFVGPTWGGDISSKAIEALIVFFLAIAAYISIRFEWRMALAAIAAVVHDLLVTVGVYAIGNFQVTPDTVIAVLTILGYSLYDTVVVFDRVEENVRGIGQTGKLTYSNTVNLSMNQVLMRSINTSLVAILPILSVLILGAYVLGATTLQYFGLALFIGLTSGAYSSIFIASPLLAVLKEKEPRYAAIRKRIEARGGEGQLLTPADVARMAIENAKKSRASIQGSKQGPGRVSRAGVSTKATGKSKAKSRDSQAAPLVPKGTSVPASGTQNQGKAALTVDVDPSGGSGLAEHLAESLAESQSVSQVFSEPESKDSTGEALESIAENANKGANRIRPKRAKRNR